LGERQPSTGPDPHWHPYTEIWAIIRGEALVQASGELVRAVAGDIVTVDAETIHSFKNCGTESLEMVCIHASRDIVQEFVS
jgi:mannose-6-phosphate isomerase-like protein (cupin superfamily)